MHPVVVALFAAHALECAFRVSKVVSAVLAHFMGGLDADAGSGAGAPAAANPDDMPPYTVKKGLFSIPVTWPHVEALFGAGTDDDASQPARIEQALRELGLPSELPAFEPAFPRVALDALAAPALAHPGRTCRGTQPPNQSGRLRHRFLYRLAFPSPPVPLCRE